MSPEIFCRQEDRHGRVCLLGHEHQSRCRFGSRRLTARQLEFLSSLAGPNVTSRDREVFGAHPCAASLVKLGLLRRTWIGMRWSRLSLTTAGWWAALEEGTR